MLFHGENITAWLDAETKEISIDAIKCSRSGVVTVRQKFNSTQNKIWHVVTVDNIFLPERN